MRQIGIRELKEQASDIMRRVREGGEVFEVTYHGRAIAHVVPVIEPKSDSSAATFWSRWEELSKAVSAEWPNDVSAAEAVSEDRRDL